MLRFKFSSCLDLEKNSKFLETSVKKFIMEFETKKLKKVWRCIECGFMYEGDEPPDICPECYAPKEAFVEVTDA
jgi:rubrerythrin